LILKNRRNIMDVKLAYSGEQNGNIQIAAFRCYYKGAILVAVNGTAEVAIAIHNCKSTGTPTAANMIAKLSLPATKGICIVDNPGGVTECPDGIRVVKSGAGTCKYHVRYSAQP
jgi:hypothetical protein